MKPTGACATKDPRICVISHGPQNWRTIVRDYVDASASWAITGPPHPTKAAALGAVDDVLCDYFGELPTRALLAARIERALAIAAQAGSCRQVERMVQALNGDLRDAPEDPDPFLADLEISVTRPAGRPRRGGMTTGETDSYVRITHKPSGTYAECDSERSQLQNKAIAMAELMRRLQVPRPAARASSPAPLPAQGRQPFHPEVTVSVVGDMFDRDALIPAVAAAMTRAGVDEAEVRLFTEEAGQFTGYMNVLRTARNWVTVTS